MPNVLKRFRGSRSVLERQRAIPEGQYSATVGHTVDHARGQQ